MKPMYVFSCSFTRKKDRDDIQKLVYGIMKLKRKKRDKK